METSIKCHKCGACCIEISISSPIPGMPEGKPAGVRCIHLDNNNLCRLFCKANRPSICRSFQSNIDILGNNINEATELIRYWEKMTCA
jgi:Fe-S-cluster containining protein